MIDLMNIDFKDGNVKYCSGYIYEEDVLQVQYPHQYILDLGYYDGIFIIYIIRDHNWSVPVVKYVIHDEAKLEEALHMAIDRISNESQNTREWYGDLWKTDYYDVG